MAEETNEQLELELKNAKVLHDFLKTLELSASDRARLLIGSIATCITEEEGFKNKLMLTANILNSTKSLVPNILTAMGEVEGLHKETVLKALEIIMADMKPCEFHLKELEQ